MRAEDPAAMVAELREWFAASPDWPVALRVPDRHWGGRVADSLFTCTFVQALERKLILELEHQILLTFTEPKEIVVAEHSVTIRDFTQLVIDWQEFVSLTPHCQRYSSGEVELFTIGWLATQERDPEAERIFETAEWVNPH